MPGAGQVQVSRVIDRECLKFPQRGIVDETDEGPVATGQGRVAGGEKPAPKLRPLRLLGPASLTNRRHVQIFDLKCPLNECQLASQGDHTADCGKPAVDGSRRRPALDHVGPEAHGHCVGFSPSLGHQELAEAVRPSGTRSHSANSRISHSRAKRVLSHLESWMIASYRSCA